MQVIQAAGRKETKIEDCQLSEEIIASTSSLKNINNSNPTSNGLPIIPYLRIC